MSGRWRRPWIGFLALLSIVGGGSLLAEQGWIRTKAGVASVLIDRAMDRHMADGARHRPWRWADTWPVARLYVPRLDVRRVVLSGATGATLAFGPGHIDGTAMPGATGNVAIAGHRDSWFAFLRDLRHGDEIRIETRSGTSRFHIDALRIVDARSPGNTLAPTTDPRLTLVTCYPFEGPGSLVRGPRRYVVTAKGSD